jgi:hypothetical protein
MLIEPVDTATQLWPGYQLISFYDTMSPDDGMRYNSSPFADCSISNIQLLQFPNVPLQAMVIFNDL